jgi:hypothetical protein
MKKLFRPLAVYTSLGVGGLLGTNWLLAQEKAVPAGDPPAKATAAPASGRLQTVPTTAGRGGDVSNTAGANDSKADANVSPVKVNDVPLKTEFALKPKDLSPAVKKGLEYLVKNQQEDGGWSQGGGWRTNVGGNGRVEGKNVEDPSDVGNTCFALLALLRSGSTATEGEYKEAVAKGLKFVIKTVDKSDRDSLFVTDVRGTQLQGKIGQYADTFLVNLTLAEFRGKAGEQEKGLVASLEKTMTKIVKHQTADGGFAGNNGWAPTLSVGIANKSIARAKERGAVVDEVVLKRAMAQSQAAVSGTTPPVVPAKEGKETAVASAAKPATGTSGTSSTGTVATATTGPVPSAAVAAAPGGAFDGRSGLAGGAGGRMAGAAGDAGVALYRVGQGAGNSQDVVNSLRVDAEKARKVLADSKASKDEKDKAEQKIDELKKAEASNDKVQAQLSSNVRNDRFVAGFGNNGGEEFLSFLNISETLVLKGGKDWDDWSAKMIAGLEKAQDSQGSWSGQHCITGKTFCTAGALLVLMADRTPFAPEVLNAAREKCNNEKKENEKKENEEKKPNQEK